MKKIIGYLSLIIINYLLISLIVFIFSLISLKNGKVYDWLWINYVQKKIYDMSNLRNVFQHSTNDCVKFDKDLIYIPKAGVCEFSNPEFRTNMHFDSERRLNKVDDKIDKDEKIIAVIGDSIAMGWGVQDNETFSYLLQELTGKKVINQGVSSYGTIREIKRLKRSKYYNQVDTIIIQYHVNDKGENIYMDPKKVYSEDDFKDYFYSYEDKSSSFVILAKMYKKTLRLLISHINDIVFPKANEEEWKFYEDLDPLEKIINNNFLNENKNIIIFTTVEPWEKFLYDKSKKYKLFDLLEIKFDHEHKFIIDMHPNVSGHKFIAKKLFEHINSSNK